MDGSRATEDSGRNPREGSLLALHRPLAPRPFIFIALAIYAAGALSHALTMPPILSRAGLWPFIATQLVLIWLWYVAHARRLADAGRGSGLALGVALLYLLSTALLLIVADSFFNTSEGPLGNPAATAALGLIVVFYVITTLLGTPQTDLAWVMVAALTLVALAPILVAVFFSLWTATRPRVPADT
jgi:hypothetical protein